MVCDSISVMKVVTIGGGTGSSVVVSALKSDKEVEISAIVAVSDNGGSTGRLRDEFGFLPVGDLRQALAALATDTENDWIRKVLLYRFEKGSGLEGHNLGNLLLTALQDQLKVLWILPRQFLDFKGKCCQLRLTIPKLKSNMKMVKK
jgi:uncharacterized cofD-like protein